MVIILKGVAYLIVAGIDVGSLSTEAVLLVEDTILSYEILATGADSRGAAERAYLSALTKAGVSEEAVLKVVATGYGRLQVPRADRQVSEITCHARGAGQVFPGTQTVIDVGGQDAKVIRMGPSGEVRDFALNDKCAAGTGRFLEVMARALETDLAGFSALAFSAKKAAVITSMCTVFAETEVVALIGQGTPREEDILGLCEAVADRITALVHRVGLAPRVVMTGGVAKNKSVVAAVSRKLEIEVEVPSEPQIIGALGAALLAREYLR